MTKNCRVIGRVGSSPEFHFGLGAGQFESHAVGRVGSRKLMSNSVLTLYA